MQHPRIGPARDVANAGHRNEQVAMARETIVLCIKSRRVWCGGERRCVAGGKGLGCNRASLLYVACSGGGDGEPERLLPQSASRHAWIEDRKWCGWISVVGVAVAALPLQPASRPKMAQMDKRRWCSTVGIPTQLG
jgi:hypothetical protein